MLTYSDGSTSNVSADATLKLSYLNFPMVFQFDIFENFKGEFGGQLGFLLSSEIKATVSGMTVNQSVNGYNTLDGGLSLGLNYEIYNGINVGTRYYFGLLNTARNSNNGGIKNSVFSFGLGYSFN